MDLFTGACGIILTFTFFYLGGPGRTLSQRCYMLMNQTGDKEKNIDQALFQKNNKFSILSSL